MDWEALGGAVGGAAMVILTAAKLIQDRLQDKKRASSVRPAAASPLPHSPGLHGAYPQVQHPHLREDDSTSRVQAGPQPPLPPPAGLPVAPDLRDVLGRLAAAVEASTKSTDKATLMMEQIARSQSIMADRWERADEARLESLARLSERMTIAMQLQRDMAAQVARLTSAGDLGSTGSGGREGRHREAGRGREMDESSLADKLEPVVKPRQRPNPAGRYSMAWPHVEGPSSSDPPAVGTRRRR